MLAFVSPAPLSSPRRRPRHMPSQSPALSTCASTLSTSARTDPPSTPPASPSPSLPPLIPSSPKQSCGFAALLGPSNSGKSTLLNRLIGQKVAIVTPKVQTTRCRIAGIATYSSTQVVFLDTPGIFEPSSRLARAMVKTAWVSGAQADAVAVVLDAAEMFHEARRVGVRKLYVSEAVSDVLKGVAERRKRGHSADMCVCANKIDAVPEGEHAFVEEKLKGLIGTIGLGDVGAQLFMISARRGDGLVSLVDWVTKRMPRGPWLYPEDDLTDMPARLLAAEVTREKAFLVLRNELPYEIAIETTSYREQENGSIRITQDVLVARDSQKIIVTGRGGSVVKAIGMTSRKELEDVLGTTVHLMLTVKVKSKWKEDKRQYEQWGLDYNA